MMTKDERPTLLLVGSGEPMEDFLRQELERLLVSVEHAPTADAARAVMAAAPDLVLLVGDAVHDGGTGVLRQLASSPGTSVVPVALLLDDVSLDLRLRAFRSGAVAVLQRTASAESIAERIAELSRELPERPGEAAGGLGESTLDELVALVSQELRSGILSVAGADEQPVRLVLGAGRPVAEALEEFVAKLTPLVAEAEPLRYELLESTGGRLMLFGREADRGDLAVLDGLRVLLMGDDPGRAEVLARVMRDHGALVGVTEVNTRGLDHASGLDPTVIVLDAQALDGDGFDAVRAFRLDVRLRWAGLLLARWDELWPEGASSPDLGELAGRLQPLVAPDLELARRATVEEAFDTRLELTGPSRLLRALGGVEGTRHLTVRSPKATIAVDLTDGLVVGATAREISGRTSTGLEALGVLLGTSNARVNVERRQHPAAATMVSPVDEVLQSALTFVPAPAPSQPPQPLFPERASAPFATEEELRTRDLIALTDDETLSLGKPPGSSPEQASPAPAVLPADSLSWGDALADGPFDPTPRAPSRSEPRDATDALAMEALAPLDRAPVDDLSAAELSAAELAAVELAAGELRPTDDFELMDDLAAVELQPTDDFELMNDLAAGELQPTDGLEPMDHLAALELELMDHLAAAEPAPVEPASTELTPDDGVDAAHATGAPTPFARIALKKQTLLGIPSPVAEAEAPTRRSSRPAPARKGTMVGIPVASPPPSITGSEPVASESAASESAASEHSTAEPSTAEPSTRERADFDDIHDDPTVVGDSLARSGEASSAHDGNSPAPKRVNPLGHTQLALPAVELPHDAQGLGPSTESDGPDPGLSASSSAPSDGGSPDDPHTGDEHQASGLVADELPADELPADELPADELPANELPANELPADELPADELPADELPANELQADGLPARSEASEPDDAGATPAKRGSRGTRVAVGLTLLLAGLGGAAYLVGPLVAPELFSPGSGGAAASPPGSTQAGAGQPAEVGAENGSERGTSPEPEPGSGAETQEETVVEPGPRPGAQTATSAEADFDAESEPVPSSQRERARRSDRLAAQAERAAARGDLAEAEVLARRSERLDRDNPQTSAAWAAVHLAAGRTAEAIAAAEAAARRRPRRSAYHVLVGDARRAAGDTAGARRAYQQALEVDPRDRTARRRLAE